MNGRVAVYKKESLPWPESEGAGKWRDISGEVSAKFKFYSFSLEKYCYVWSMDWSKKKVYLDSGTIAGSATCRQLSMLSLQTLQGNYSESWTSALFTWHLMTFIFLESIYSETHDSISITFPSSISLFLQPKQDHLHTTINSIGKPSLNSLVETFNKMINSNWLSLDAPHSNTEPLISLPFTFTAVVASSYLVFITDSTYPFIHTRTSQS